MQSHLFDAVLSGCGSGAASSSRVDGDGEVGGMSTIMSTLKLLLTRDYDFAAICFSEQEYLDNASALEPRTTKLGIPIFRMDEVASMPEPREK